MQLLSVTFWPHLPGLQTSPLAVSFFPETTSISSATAWCTFETAFESAVEVDDDEVPPSTALQIDSLSDSTTFSNPSSSTPSSHVFERAMEHCSCQCCLMDRLSSPLFPWPGSPCRWQSCCSSPLGLGHMDVFLPEPPFERVDVALEQSMEWVQDSLSHKAWFDLSSLSSLKVWLALVILTTYVAGGNPWASNGSIVSYQSWRLDWLAMQVWA